jgi:hypothetical protein
MAPRRAARSRSNDKGLRRRVGVFEAAERMGLRRTGGRYALQRPLTTILFG